MGTPLASIDPQIQTPCGRGRHGSGMGAGSRGGRGTAGRRVGRGRGRALSAQILAPEGWEPPKILSERASPIFLRPRHGQPHVQEDRHELGVIDIAAAEEIVEDGGYDTPPPNYSHEVWVRVRLETLGVDSSIWGDIDTFRGIILDRYYHEVHGMPMYTIDFGGGIGHREVLVSTATLDLSPQSLPLGATQ